VSADADKSRQNRFVFLDVMRGIAPVLVIYSHVVALFLVPEGEQTGVVDLLNENFRDPLRLEQQMGHLAVVMFFLVSGFIITQVGTQESHREFAIKRLFRVYPLLIVVVLLTAILSIWHLEVLRTGQHFEITLQSVLTNFALANYLMVPQIILVGVAWTLVIEVIFYTIVLSLLAVLRRWAWVAILTEMGMVLAALLLAREFGPSFFLLAVNMSYLPVVLLGQVTWAVWSGRVPLWAGTLLGLGCWTLYVLGDIRNMGRLDDAYNSTAALGFGLFIVLLLAESKLRPMKPISFFADRSYSLYLLHGPVAFPVFTSLYGKLPLIVVIILGLALTVGCAELTFRYIEQPGQRIGRALSRRFRLRKKVVEEPPEDEDEYYDEDDYYDDYEDDYEDNYDGEYEEHDAYVEPPTRPAARPAPPPPLVRPAPPRRVRPPRRTPGRARELEGRDAGDLFTPSSATPAWPTEEPAWPTESPDEDVARPRNGHVPNHNGARNGHRSPRAEPPRPAPSSGRHRRRED
jgi:peptidoglycan/LPS O-acetylase OafA/YrhL